FVIVFVLRSVEFLGEPDHLPVYRPRITRQVSRPSQLVLNCGNSRTANYAAYPSRTPTVREGSSYAFFRNVELMQRPQQRNQTAWDLFGLGDSRVPMQSFVQGPP